MATDGAWDGVRLHVVSGKGGTGKTTVAAALALALAAEGRTVLLCEVEDRQGIAQLFDVPPLPYEERKVAVAPGGGDVYALAIDPEAALLEYLQMYYKLGRAGRTLDRFGVVEFATTIAPGLSDVLLTGKVYEAVSSTRRNRGRVYDAVVLDAPPTGRLPNFLNVNSAVAGVAKVGPVRAQAEAIMSLLRSAATAVHLVTLLEDMPVQESADCIAALRAAALPVGGVVVNRVPHGSEAASDPARVGALSAAQVADGVRAAGLAATPQLVAGLLSEASDAAERLALEAEQRHFVEALQRPTYELPLLPDGVDLGGLYELAQELREQGMA